MSQLLTKGYQQLNNVLPLDFCKQASNETAKHIETQPISYDFYRGFHFVWYNPPMMKDMLEVVKPRIEKLVGEELFPTYSFLTTYTNNSYMSAHKDRDACEISISINLSSSLDWKLYIKDLQEQEVALSTTVGNGVAYLGTKVEHWRNLLISDKPQFFMQTFLHYVRANGEYANLKNDTSVHPV